MDESQNGVVKMRADYAELNDPFEVRIQEEVEEFLRDLTLEFPFEAIFETLRRFEFRGRYGPKVIPLPRTINSQISREQTLKDVHLEIDRFLKRLEDGFGEKYSHFIQDSFRYYTETTFE